MIRCRFGLFLLIFLLLCALVCSWAMVKLHRDMARDLSLAAEEARKGNWLPAARYAAHARRDWDRWAFFRCTMADHTAIEALDVLFDTMEVYAAAREEVPFTALCREAALQLEAMGDAHRLTLSNLL